MLRWVAAFCRPLRPVLLLVSFPRSRSSVVGVPGLCWMWHGVPFARQWRPVVGVLPPAHPPAQARPCPAQARRAHTLRRFQFALHLPHLRVGTRTGRLQTVEARQALVPAGLPELRLELPDVDLQLLQLLVALLDVPPVLLQLLRVVRGGAGRHGPARGDLVALQGRHGGGVTGGMPAGVAPGGPFAEGRRGGVSVGSWGAFPHSAGTARARRGHGAGTAPDGKLPLPGTTLHTTDHRGGMRPWGKTSGFGWQSGIFSAKHGLI